MKFSRKYRVYNQFNTIYDILFLTTVKFVQFLIIARKVSQSFLQIPAVSDIL